MSTIDDETARIERTSAAFSHHDPAQVEITRRFGIFDDLIRGCPMGRSEKHGGFWHVTRYADVAAVALDTRTFSNAATSVPAVALGGGGFPSLPPDTLDPPEHTMFRKLMLPSFSARIVNKWEGWARANAASLIAEFAERGHCDAAKEYARHIPIRLMALMLGVPPEHDHLFTSWVSRAVEHGASNPEDALRAANELGEYLGERIAERREKPEDDLLSLFLTSDIDGHRLDAESVLGAAILLVVAGNDTTWSAIGSALWHFAQHPEQRARLVAEPHLMPTAVEECLRFYAPTVLGRRVTKDSTYEGNQLSEGDQLLLCFAAANRDPAEFPEPDRFIIDRKPNRHLTFGHGVHRCIGANAARMEIRVALEEWLRVIPDFSLDGPDPVHWATGPNWGPRRLDLRWDI